MLKFLNKALRVFDIKKQNTLNELCNIQFLRTNEIKGDYAKMRAFNASQQEACFKSQLGGEFVSVDGDSMFVFSHINQHQAADINTNYHPQICQVSLNKSGLATIEMSSFEGGLATLTCTYNPSQNTLKQIVKLNAPLCLNSRNVYTENPTYPYIDTPTQIDLCSQLGFFPVEFSSNNSTYRFSISLSDEIAQSDVQPQQSDLYSMLNTILDNQPLQDFISQKAQEFGFEKPLATTTYIDQGTPLFTEDCQ